VRESADSDMFNMDDQVSIKVMPSSGNCGTTRSPELQSGTMSPAIGIATSAKNATKIKDSGEAIMART